MKMEEKVRMEEKVNPKITSSISKENQEDKGRRTNNNNVKKLNTKYLVQISLLGAVATVLMLFQFPLWFAPPFYQIDLSEVAVLIGAFAMGPLAGVLIELIKVLLNLIIDGSITAGVGELSNFIVGCAWVVPASIIYKKKRSKKGAIISLLVGSTTMVLLACVLNAFVILPAYSVAMGMPLENLINMGTAISPSITNLLTFVCFAVAPFNITKGILISVILLLLYKKISVILKIAR